MVNFTYPKVQKVQSVEGQIFSLNSNRKIEEKSFCQKYFFALSPYGPACSLGLLDTNYGSTVHMVTLFFGPEPKFIENGASGEIDLPRTDNDLFTAFIFKLACVLLILHSRVLSFTNLLSLLGILLF